MTAVSNSSPLCSVVIVSWNTRDLLDDCLRSVFANLNGRETTAEVWVVDNASTDASAQMVREKYPVVRLLENQENIGFARANNQALRQANGQYFLLLNSDTVVPENAFAQLMSAATRNAQAAVCGPLLLNADGSPQHNWARFQTLGSELRGTLDRSQSPYPLADFADPAKRAQMKAFAVDWIGGACLLVRADAARQVGLLDENFFMYCEETEWCYRLRSEGETLLVPSVTVTHLGGGSSGVVPAATRRRMWRSSLRLYRVLYGPLGALAPAVTATGRYILSVVRRRRAAWAK